MAPYPPKWLCPTAKAYWKRHATRLSGAGLLDHSTADQFAVHCDVFAKWRQTDPENGVRYVGLVKQVQATGKPFGFFAKAAPRKTNIADVLQKLNEQAPASPTSDPTDPA